MQAQVIMYTDEAPAARKFAVPFSEQVKKVPNGFEEREARMANIPEWF
jgi:hypothetical protein